MIELNEKYTTSQLAAALGVSYGTLRNQRKEYEKHLSLFYFFEKEDSGRATYYTFCSQIDDYIPYKDFKRNNRDKVVTEGIKTVIAIDNRQTAANIARVLFRSDKPKEIQDLKLSTLKVYVRAQLKDLVTSGYYDKSDYAWCYLDKENSRYVLMSPEEVAELRTCFNSQGTKEEEENIFAKYNEGDINEQELEIRLGKLRKNTFIEGLKQYQQETGYWCIKVPLFKTKAW